MVAIKRLLDPLASCAALLALSPVVTFLDRPVLLLAGAALAGGWWCDRCGRYPLAPRAATMLALGGVLWYVLQVGNAAEIGRPLVNALAVLLAVRLLTVKLGRDYLQIFVLSLFLLAGSSLLSLSIGFIVYLAFTVLVVTVSLMLLTVYVTDPCLAFSPLDLRRLLRVALLLPAGSLLLMLGFFIILPRTGQPLWSFLTPAGQAVSGLAESVSPGLFARLADVRAPAFRADGPELPAEERYWRALVLNRPEGGRWIRGVPPGEGAGRPLGGRQVRLTIYPEPRSENYLVTLDRPLLLEGLRFRGDADQVFQLPMSSGQRFRYQVTVAIGADWQVKAPQRDFYLRTPDAVSPRLAAVAAKIIASGPDSETRLAALADFFRGQRLIYARDNLPVGADPLAAFLFDERRGYCEFFAVAYVTLARLAGIPARLVGGYYGGDYNALGGYYLVTDAAAHVWVEVLTDQGVWRRVDPSQWASNSGTAMERGDTTGLQSWYRLADTLNYYWVQLVVAYDLGRQVELWRATRSAWSGWQVQELGWWGVILPAGVLLIWGGWRVVGHYRHRPGREARLVASLRARARRRLTGEKRLESLTLEELAERLDSPACREFAGIYQGAIFRDRTLSAEEFSRLEALLKKI